MIEDDEYKQRYYSAVDVKIRRNVKLKLDRRIASGITTLPEFCQKKGCESINHKIVFRDYGKLSFLSLCETHVTGLIKRTRAKFKFGDDGVKWYDEGVHDGSYSSPITNHLLHVNYYKGYRVGFHGEYYEMAQITSDGTSIKFCKTSKRYW